LNDLISRFRFEYDALRQNLAMPNKTDYESVGL